MSNTMPLAFGGTGAGDYLEVFDWSLVAFNPFAGFPVTSGTADLVGLYNPTAGPVTYSIFLAGV